uniref:Kazal-like domain-containing protein n=1 Tax=Cuerna arida TaxID=1464854 RepID=A0A1B6F5G5_9HEMI
MGVIRPQPLRSSNDTVYRMTTDQDVDCGCTCNGYKLFQGLQRFAKPSVFVAVLIAFALVLGAIQGFFNVHYTTNSINASFGLVEWLMLGSQVIQGLIIIPIAYAGGRRHRPVWLGAFGGFLVISCFIFGSIILAEYENTEVVTTYSLKQDPTLCVKYTERVVQYEENQDWTTLTAVYLLSLSLGLTNTCFFAFAITYLDDNVDSVNSPGIIGIVLGLQQLGPLLGMMLAWLCSTTIVTGILWIVLGVVMLVVSVILGLFPRSLLDNQGGLASNSIYYTKNKGFIGSFLRVVTNKIFLLITFGLTLAYTAIWNFRYLLTRYEESVYYASQANGFDDPWTTRQIITFLRPVLTGAAIIAAGIIIFRSEPSPTKLSIWTTGGFFFCAAVFAANIFLSCSNIHIITESNSRLDLTMYCNKDCQCKEDLAFTPVYASQARLVYFSPCHAGCTTATYDGSEKVYKNCSCVPTESVVNGVYDAGSCQLYGIVFECLTIVVAVLAASTVIGLIMLLFRVVLNCDKPMMIALHLTIVTQLATIPGRQLFLFVARWSCIVSGTDECRLHEAQPFVTYINLTTILFLLLSVGVFAVTSFTVRNVVLFGEDDRSPTHAAAMTELREFRAKNSNGKGRRHSFHGEDQKLLDTDGIAPVVVKRTPSISVPVDGEHRLSTYEGQMQKAASYSDELNKLLQAPPAPGPGGNTLQVPSPGVTVRREGMLTTLL